MPNIITVDEETKVENIKKQVNYLKQFLEEKESWQTPYKYVILEYFPHGKENYTADTYEIHNLTINAIEDGVIYFDDAEGIFEEKMYNDESLKLHVILIDRIIYMQFHDMENKITISFSDGYIQIYY